ncbi:uncharacterized protein AtWU_05816 [Aspergillus tubingensis]|uniref:uncharacterized protein n=1 Tax=Aspergillus tubingensis TaxID=5068 RepID=UPI00157995FD|nr:uncharacterized protein AtWU_05816 [Aspergillus tubingensis]GFN16015.1 hypothetical protein AtWU_05816 [Aspergillus tubingensis]
MMFAPLPMQQQPGSSPPPPQQQHQQYTPTRPSPLSPRRLTNTPSATPNIFAATSNNSAQFNIPSSPFTLPTPTKLPSISASAPPSPTPPQQQQQQSHHQFARRQRNIQSSPNYAHRYANTISNPMTKHLKSSASPSARRNVFLNRVKRDRDDGRFGDRGEQLVLMEHVAEEKRWGEVMRRRAEEMMGVVEEEEEEGYANGYDDVDAYALDEYLQEQAAEMERLEYLNQQPQPQQQQHHHGLFDSGGPAGRGNGGMNISFSDEEEYDDLFMDLAGHDGGPDIPGSSGGFAHSQDMDMS